MTAINAAAEMQEVVKDVALLVRKNAVWPVQAEARAVDADNFYLAIAIE
jgi:hypothetical protein